MNKVTTSITAEVVNINDRQLAKLLKPRKWPRKLKKAVRKLWEPTKEGFNISGSIPPGKWNNKAMRMIIIKRPDPEIMTITLPFYRGGYRTFYFQLNPETIDNLTTIF